LIVISTPTGQIGSKVTAAVIDGDEPVRVIARDPGGIPAQIAARVEIVTGSHDDARVMDEALEGADSLFWLIPPGFQVDDIYGHYVDFTRPAAEAIHRHGTERVVAVSALGRGYNGDAGVATAAIAMTGLLESTGAATRTLTCPGFMDNLLRSEDSIRDHGVFYGTVSRDRKLPHAATADIATVGAQLLKDHSWRGHADVAVLGPEDLSFDEVAAILSEVLEKEVRYVQVPLDALRAQMQGVGASAGFIDGMVAMMAAKDDGLDNLATRTPQNTTATSLRQWARETLKPAIFG
jgi:uncharacterized protein YbjT (DUF2867 family)